MVLVSGRGGGLLCLFYKYVDVVQQVGNVYVNQVDYDEEEDLLGLYLKSFVGEGGYLLLYEGVVDEQNYCF